MRPVDGEVTGVVAVEMDDDEGVLRAWILLALHDGALNWLIGPRALLTVTMLLIVHALDRACAWLPVVLAVIHEAWNEEQGRSQSERWG
jgi:hypothetical protein